MALFSVTILPPLTSCLDLPRVCPPCAVRTSSVLRRPLYSSKVPVHTHTSFRPRASPAGGDPQSSDGEDSFQQRAKSPEDDDPANSPPESTLQNDASLTSLNHVAAVQFERDRKQEHLRETLDTLSRSLELLSSTLIEMSSAVRGLSAALSPSSQLQVASSPSGAVESELTERTPPPSDPPEPWDNAAAERGVAGSAGPVEGVISRREDDTIPSHLVEENERAHKLAYRLQQAFIEARIEGLGKPFQVAAEDFVQACMEAHRLGIGLKELQLQLVLQDGSLTGAFAIRNQRWSDDPIVNEETRIRSLWVRLVYATLTQQEPTYTEEGEMDPTDAFVKQVILLAREEGYDLERLKLEHAFVGSDTGSAAVKVMRENQYLILLTLEKSKPQE